MRKVDKSDKAVILGCLRARVMNRQHSQLPPRKSRTRLIKGHLDLQLSKHLHLSSFTPLLHPRDFFEEAGQDWPGKSRETRPGSKEWPGL